MVKNRLFTEWDFLDKNTIRFAQITKLKTFLRDHVIPFSHFYRDMFNKAHIDPEKFTSLDDLRQIPFTAKNDLLVTSDHPDRARDFVLIPNQSQLSKRPRVMLRALLSGKAQVKAALQREYRPIFLTSTTGRSSEPIGFFYTAYDLDNLASAGKRLVDVVGAVPEERAINMFPYAPHLAFWQAHYATTAFGVFAVSTGGGKAMGTDGNLRLMEKIQPNTVLGMPTFLYHVLTQAADEGRSYQNLTTLVLGGEKVPPGMRNKLATLVKLLSGNTARVVATYGFTEAKMAWGECPFQLDQPASGYHLYPDLGLFEVIDPESGEVLPEGSPGELVFTPLDARGSVVLRYRTGDCIDGGLIYEPCPYCKRIVPRLVGNISRESEVRELRFDKIKGTLVDFNELEHLLDDAEYIGAWQVELRKMHDDPLELDELILHVERIGSKDDETVSRQLANLVAAHTEIHPNQILFHSRRHMRKRQGVGEELKEKRLVDHRPNGSHPLPPRDSSQWHNPLSWIFKRMGATR
ncbi:MAG: phenylacetate--CoA ligase [Nitrospiraceae bacterium]|nr:phenylacetate--CoA ligase [Nitrospiraceae bacterium]